MIELSITQTVEILDGLVEEFGGDYVYDKGENGKCEYVRDGAPSCIVGHVLFKAGVPIERLAKADVGNFGSGIGAGNLLNQLEAEGALQFDGSVRTLLAEAQYRQDSLTSWGASVQAAKKYAQV